MLWLACPRADGPRFVSDVLRRLARSFNLVKAEPFLIMLACSNTQKEMAMAEIGAAVEQVRVRVLRHMIGEIDGKLEQVEAGEETGEVTELEAELIGPE